MAQAIKFPEPLGEGDSDAALKITGYREDSLDSVPKSSGPLDIDRQWVGIEFILSRKLRYFEREILKRTDRENPDYMDIRGRILHTAVDYKNLVQEIVDFDNRLAQLEEKGKYFDETHEAVIRDAEIELAKIKFDT